MLKRIVIQKRREKFEPAAFRRLCVETFRYLSLNPSRCRQPPSGGCVLKPIKQAACRLKPSPAAFRRLCVETGSITKSDLL